MERRAGKELILIFANVCRVILVHFVKLVRVKIGKGKHREIPLVAHSFKPTTRPIFQTMKGDVVC